MTSTLTAIDLKEQAEPLRHIAVLKGISIAAFVRLAIENQIRHEKQSNPKAAAVLRALSE